MADRQIGAEVGFSQALALLILALRNEEEARRDPGCRGLIKQARKHRAACLVLIVDGLIETAQP